MDRTRTLENLYPAVDAQAASTHLELLHAGGSGYLSIVAMHGRKINYGFCPLSDLRPRVPLSEGRDALQDLVNDRFDVYTACATFSEVPEKGRGRVNDVSSIPGVWADLDVKPGLEGHFQSEQEIMNYLDQFPAPTLLINSGSGGRHAYWLVDPAVRYELSGTFAPYLLMMWRDLLLAKAGGLEIDNVQDTTRILRLAGTVRWPKDGESRPPRRVELEISDGPRYYTDQLRLAAQEAHEAAQIERLARRQRTKTEREQLAELESIYGPSSTNQLDPCARFRVIKSKYNETEDWARLLEPDGWTLFTDRGQCRYWTRPGKSTRDGKSAATDYVDEDHNQSHLMTIYSEDPDLAKIVETITPAGRRVCSKWYYTQVMMFDGDETALINYVSKRRKTA